MTEEQRDDRAPDPAHGAAGGAAGERSPKIVITGTGRSGTTLLVQLLTELGLDTGYRPGVKVDAQARAGLERDILSPSAPRVVKSPGLSTLLRGMLEQDLVEIEHVIVPVRDLDVASASRVRAAGYGRRPAAAGGLWGARTAARQKERLAESFYELVSTLVDHDVPHTFLAFPRFAQDWEYAFGKLSFLAPGASPEEFRSAMEGLVRPDFIHEEVLDRRERWRARLMTPVVIARKIAARIARRAGRRRG